MILPQRVDAYWHCCLLATTVIDKPRTVAAVSEAGCDNVETETVYDDSGEDATRARVEISGSAFAIPIDS